jgi:hypothetical protein
MVLGDSTLSNLNTILDSFGTGLIPLFSFVLELPHKIFISFFGSNDGDFQHWFVSQPYSAVTEQKGEVWEDFRWRHLKEAHH